MRREVVRLVWGIQSLQCFIELANTEAVNVMRFPDCPTYCGFCDVWFDNEIALCCGTLSKRLSILLEVFEALEKQCPHGTGIFNPQIDSPLKLRAKLR